MKMAMTPEHFADLLSDATSPGVTPAIQVQRMFNYFLTIDEDCLDFDACAHATITSMRDVVNEQGGRVIFQDKENS